MRVKKLAERVGFEPTLPFRVNTLSKRAPSATRPSLRRAIENERGASKRLNPHWYFADWKPDLLSILWVKKDDRNFRKISRFHSSSLAVRAWIRRRITSEDSGEFLWIFGVRCGSGGRRRTQAGARRASSGRDCGWRPLRSRRRCLGFRVVDDAMVQTVKREFQSIGNSELVVDFP